MEKIKSSGIKLNLSMSFIVQLANSILPLAIIPYLSRVLGVSEYGRLVWIQSIMNVGIILVEFGCGWSSLVKVSENRHDKAMLGNIIVNTWTLQCILFFTFSATVVLCVAFADKSRLEIYIAGLGMVAGYLLTPSWLFQGLETFWPLAVAQCIGKLVLFPLVFMLVKSQESIEAAILCFSLTSLLTGLISMIFALRLIGTSLTKPNLHSIKQFFLELVPLFASRALITTYTIFVPLAVGSIAGLQQLAYFNIIDRIKSSVQSLIAPIQQATFPRISSLIKNDSTKARILIKKTYILIFLGTSILGLLLFFLPGLFIALLGGIAFAPAQSSLQWLAFAPLIISVSNLLGLQVMIPLSMNKQFYSSILIGSIFCALAIYPFVRCNGAIGAAQVVLATEFVIVIAMFFMLRLEVKAKNNRLLNLLFFS